MSSSSSTASASTSIDPTSIPATDAAAPTNGSPIFRELRERMRAAGLLDGKDYFWVIKLAIWIPGFWAAFTALHMVHFGFLWCALALVSALGMLQMGFAGHDCGHFALSKSRRVNDWVGQFCMTMVAGMSFGHWRHQHNRHHAHCQESAHDPDMQFGVLFSVYPESEAWKHSVGRFFLAIQPYSFWPLTLLYWITLRYDAVRDVFQKPDETKADRLFLPLHFGLLLIGPMILFGWKMGLIDYVVVSSIGTLFTAAVFVPNHIGMPILKPGDDLEFVRHQVLTSRDLTNPPIVDFFFGGLNSQIEHHLFPRVSHGRLRRSRAVVKQFCLDKGIPYYEQSTFGALAEVTRHLARMRDASRAARTSSAVDLAA